MRAVVFSGPSLPRHLVEAVEGVVWRPPAKQGDLYRAALHRPALIGLVDGMFETVPTVWHKEILWAMSHGIHVYGAASIGALRAAELCSFGMKGVGAVFEAYRDGVLQDDDEIALQHGPEELGFVAVTEPMVNVRATIQAALRCGLVDGEFAVALTKIAKGIFYKERTYKSLIAAAAENGLTKDGLNRFERWLPRNSLDLKSLDGQALLDLIRRDLLAVLAPMQTAYEFANTAAWQEVVGNSEAETEEPINEMRTDIRVFRHNAL
jgi:hypothetical protein